MRFRKIIVERVTVVKFRVDNRGSNGTDWFRIEVRTDTAELTDVRIAELRKRMGREKRLSIICVKVVICGGTARTYVCNAQCGSERTLVC